MAKTQSALAAAFVASLTLAIATSASAADLGGNCCADLEERIAELEATTARKGNRKVSLEIGGQINEAVMFWDDGGESNAYVVTNDNARSRFRFRGKAKINEDWEAGYAMETGVRITRSNRFTQSDDNAGSGLDLRDSYWFLKSKTYGGVSVGFQGTATDQITEINLTQTKDFAKLSDMEDTGLGLFLRSSANGGLSPDLQFFELLGVAGDQPGDGDRRSNVVKYETPAYKGFTASTAWGEDDVWDVALRYAGEFGGFKVAAGIGYGENNDGNYTGIDCNVTIGAGTATDKDCSNFGGSVSVMHEATGLFVSAGAGTKKDKLLNDSPIFTGTDADDTQDFWSMQAGIEKKFFPLGKTTVFGEYYDYEGAASRQVVDGADPINALGVDAQVWKTGLEAYGFGVAQGIDAAAMVLYLHYRHVEADLTVRALAGGVASGAESSSSLEDLDIVTAGGIIKF
jgi:hypothetical protein